MFNLRHVKGLVHVPPLPANLAELKQTMATTLQTATQDMLQRIWEELEYRIDMCRVSGILNIFEIGYEIHISLNFSFKFGGIILILINIKSVYFH